MDKISPALLCWINSDLERYDMPKVKEHLDTYRSLSPPLTFPTSASISASTSPPILDIYLCLHICPRWTSQDYLVP
jgi:hypothetical protein